MGERYTPAFLGIVTLVLFIFLFVTNLILLPYYLVKSISFVLIHNWFTATGRDMLKENINILYGLMVCSVMTTLIVIYGNFYLDK